MSTCISPLNRFLISYITHPQPESDGSRSGSSLSLRNLTGPDGIQTGTNSQVQSPTHRRVHRSISATSTNPSRRASSGGETLRKRNKLSRYIGKRLKLVSQSQQVRDRPLPPQLPTERLLAQLRLRHLLQLQKDQQCKKRNVKKCLNFDRLFPCRSSNFKRQNTIDAATIKENTARLASQNQRPVSAQPKATIDSSKSLIWHGADSQ